MDPKHQKNLDFLQEQSPLSAEDNLEIFERHKYDLRLSLWEALWPKEEKEALFLIYEGGNYELSERLQALEKLLLFYCPNPKFKAIMLDLKRRKTVKIKPTTAENLQKFRRIPTKAEIFRFFDALGSKDEVLASRLLLGLQDFGREVATQERYIQMMAEADDLSLADAALTLLARIPGAFARSLPLYQFLLHQPNRRFQVLKNLQGARGLNPELLFSFFRPIIGEYERLARKEGMMNDLWPEMQLIRSILANNGGGGRVWQFESEVLR
ncbi:hypothetical protein PPO43_12725 [Saprospira sp. CCB-QB6]|uniref:hypothetical protein n=1 Tax=Saprospira sp. CCB-QB6 TaxID=3023936 RepID=UPI0023492A99|nr:hypothetical protein [Saprospira sp. CCB-QB6]WCL80836.1 hypothetical protein PPO43_12725 [Saprospira sp. CCB-QB6]